MYVGKSIAPYEYIKKLLNINEQTRLDMDKKHFEVLKYRFKRVILDMSNGMNNISNVALFYLPKGVRGFTNQIVRNNKHGSRFGNYHYIIQEKTYITNITINHILQLAFFNYILGKIQNYTPKEFYIVYDQPTKTAYNRKPTEKVYQYEKYAVLLYDTISQTRQIMSMNHTPSIHNSYLSWGNYYNRMARETGDIFLLNGIGLTKKLYLLNANIKNLNDIITIGVDGLCKIEGIGKKTANNYILGAKAIISGEHIKKTETMIQQNDVDIFFDLKKIEYPLDPLDLDYIPYIHEVTYNYLIGFTINDEYKSFVVENKNGRKTLKEFIDYIKTLKNYKLYQWTHEKTRLKKIFNEYDILEEDQKIILDNLVNLHPIATQSFAFPVQDTLEIIAAWMGFSWKYNVVDRLNITELYKNYIDKDNINNLQLIQDYSKDYCNATKFIKEWLLAN